MSETEEELKVVNDLSPSSKKVNIKVKCSSKNEEREILSKKTGEKLRVTEAVVGDDTGSILLTLWGDDIDKMLVEHAYQINNGYCTVFKTSLRLNIGKYGSMQEITEGVPEQVNLENNLSNKAYEQEERFRPRFGGGGGSRPGGYGRRPSYGRDQGYRGERGERGDRGDSGRPPRRRF